LHWAWAVGPCWPVAQLSLFGCIITFTGVTTKYAFIADAAYSIQYLKLKSNPVCKKRREDGKHVFQTCAALRLRMGAARVEVSLVFA
jgi:hypothetical protein